MEKTEEKGIFNKAFAWYNNATMKGLLGAVLLAFIIIIILLFAFRLPSVIRGFSSSLSAALYSVFVPAESATMTADKKIVDSGEDFNIIFKNPEGTSGLFTVTYACDLNIDLLSVEANGLKKIKCDVPYYLLENETAIQIRPESEESVVRLVLEGSFENNDTQKTEKIGAVRVTVKNDSPDTVADVSASSTKKNAVTNTAPKKSPTVSTQNQAVYYSKPDLAARILQVGLLNERTNLIVPQNQFSNNDTVGIKFEIRNDGSADTGIWSFSAYLPSLSTPVFNSGNQISLRPGDSIIFTLGFSNLTNQYSSLITVNVDPSNIIKESNEANNALISIIANNSYNNRNYNYNSSNNGCYINGVFSYNCYNNNNYYNNDYSFNGSLGVTCYAEPNDPETGDRVRWYAEALGGDGDYDYEWSGTNNLDSSSRNPTKTYSTRGTKYATVTVESDNRFVSYTCSVRVD